MKIIQTLRIFFTRLLILVGGLTVLAAGVVWIATLNIEKIEHWESQRQLSDRMILDLDFAYDLSSSDFAFFETSAPSQLPALSQLIDAIYTAKDDKRVTGLLIRAGVGFLTTTEVQELRTAITAFRASGKKTFAFAESYGEGGDGTLHYYLASAAEELWIQPSGSLDITGYRLETPYARAALDKVGISPQFAWRKDFKGILQSYSEETPPAPVAKNTQNLLDSLLAQTITAIATSRQQETTQIRAAVDGGPLNASAAQARGLIDHLGYWDQLIDKRIMPLGADMVALPSYAQAHPAPTPSEDVPRLAFIAAQGEIHMGESNYGTFGRSLSIGSATLSTAIEDAALADDIDALVIRIDSPGGSYVASDTIRRAIVFAREQGKKVTVSMGDVVASGGYFIATAADKIYANPGTITGSIGVAGGKFALDNLWQKLGINWSIVTAGQNADLYSTNRKFSPEGWRLLNNDLNRIYSDFTARVAQDRNLSAKAVKQAAQGQIWTGTDAQNLGLIDELGGLRDALNSALTDLGSTITQPYALVIFPEAPTALDAFIEQLASGSDLIGNSFESLKTLQNLLASVLAPLSQSPNTPHQLYAPVQLNASKNL